MPRKNVICLVVDRLRAAALGTYGAAWCETPALDRLAGESFVFDQAYCDSPRLDRIYRGYWQGLHALVPEDAAREYATLPATLSAAGLAASLLTDANEIAEHPLASDFDDVVHVEEADERELAASVEETQLARFFAASIEHLDALRRRKEPFFTWLHARGMAAPWDGPWELRESLIDEEDPLPPDTADVPNLILPEDFDPDDLLGYANAYAGQVQVLDHCIAALIEELRTAKLEKSTLLILVGARGFPLGEHRRVGQGDDALFGELLHVPLLVRMPDGVGALDRSQALVQPFDLAPTILDWLGMPLPEPRAGAGRSLMPLVCGDVVRAAPGDAGEAERTIRERPVIVFAGDGKRAIRTAGWYLRQLNAARVELYAKPDDRWEANEVAARCPEIVEPLEQLLSAAVPLMEANSADPLPELPAAVVTGE